MKKTTKADEATSNLSWLKRIKVAVAAFALVAAGVFGAAAVSNTPVTTPDSEETAWTLPKRISPIDEDRGPIRMGRTNSWS